MVLREYLMVEVSFHLGLICRNNNIFQFKNILMVGWLGDGVGRWVGRYLKLGVRIDYKMVLWIIGRIIRNIRQMGGYYQQGGYDGQRKMNIDMNEISFNVSMSSCYDEIMEKMQQINGIEIDFMRKFENKINHIDTHASMIYCIRQTLTRIEEIFADVKTYFVDLRIGFIYDFFRKIYLLTVLGYNYTAQAFLVSIGQKKQHKNNNVVIPTTTPIATAKPNAITLKDRYKQVEQIDYQISSLEKQEQKLSLEIKEMYNSALLHRPTVEKIKASMAAKQIAQIKDCVEAMAIQAENIFEETYSFKYQQFKSYIAKFGKPQEIGKQFCTGVSKGIKDKFMDGMTKIIIKIKHITEEQNKVITCNQQVQTDKVKNEMFKNKFQREATFIKQKKLNQKMIIDIQNLKKIQQSTAKENANNIRKYKHQEQIAKELNQNYQGLKKLFYQRSQQMEQIKCQYQWQIAHKKRQIEKISKQILDSNIYVSKEQAGTDTNDLIQYSNRLTQTHNHNHKQIKQEQFYKKHKDNIFKSIIKNHSRDSSKIQQIQKIFQQHKQNNQQILCSTLKTEKDTIPLKQDTDKLIKVSKEINNSVPISQNQSNQSENNNYQQQYSLTNDDQVVQVQQPINILIKKKSSYNHFNNLKLSKSDTKILENQFQTKQFCNVQTQTCEVRINEEQFIKQRQKKTQIINKKKLKQKQNINREFFYQKNNNNKLQYYNPIVSQYQTTRQGNSNKIQNLYLPNNKEQNVKQLSNLKKSKYKNLYFQQIKFSNNNLPNSFYKKNNQSCFSQISKKNSQKNILYPETQGEKKQNNFKLKKLFYQTQQRNNQFLKQKYNMNNSDISLFTISQIPKQYQKNYNLPLNSCVNTIQQKSFSKINIKKSHTPIKNQRKT